MKKVLTIVVCTAISLTISSLDIQAGQGCCMAGKGSKAVAACTANSKLACTGSQLGSTCGALDQYCTPEECTQWSDVCKEYDGKCETIALTIKGMTCIDCETAIKGVLSDIEGVIDVFKVSHQAGAALVCVDPAKLTDKSLLTSAVTKKGYKAEIYVANSAASSQATTCTRYCNPSQMKNCGVKTADTPKDTDSKTK